MKFNSLKIEKCMFGNNKGMFEGQIHFDLEDGGVIWLNIDDEWSKKFVILALPLLEQATNEKIEIIKKEFLQEVEDEN